MNIVADDFDNNPMTRSKWERIKAIGAGIGRYIHVSAPIGHIVGPDGLTHSYAYKRNRSLPPTDASMCGSTYRRTGTRGQ